jgi:Carboxypeptidase regulatory-like domain/TonB dependent receptor
MNMRRTASVLIFLFLGSLPVSVSAQQTLGWIDGAVTDSSGGVLQNVAVTARNTATNLTVSARTKNDGSFHIPDLPIGNYEVTFTRDGFKTVSYPEILLQGDRTTTLNVQLLPGAVTSSVTVNATPMLNETDTTSGYILGELQIDNTPLGTGSFTQLAILSPGVSADLLNSAGTNAGYGNQAIWANGQRDTSNSFEMNGIYADNIFNGKSTSQVSSNRVAVNIGESTNPATGEIQTSTSVYGAIGQGLPTPPVETIQEVRVNTAMYDASQGANSGAHIEVSTKSGTNDFHGAAYEYHQQSSWNDNPWFNKNAGLPTPDLHRNVFGGLFGGPIKKNRLFFFASYQGQRISDQLQATSYVAVPSTLTDARDAASIAAATNTEFGTNITASQITPQALALLQAKANNGSYLIPSASPNFATLQASDNADAVVQGPAARFVADQVNGNIDYNFNSKDRLAGKYYYQRNPNTAPFAQSELLDFPQTLKAGSQAFSLINTRVLTPNLSWEQRVGFIRESAFSNLAQGLTPADAQIGLVGLSRFPQINIRYADGTYNSNDGLSIGPTSNFANAGIFQNDFEGATSLTWVNGRQTISTGVSFDYIQLNVINQNNETARITFEDFPGFLLGEVCGPNTTSCGGQDPSQVLNGASNRYYRSKQVGVYVQDDIKLKTNLTIDLGLRWDWDGPLVEKNGYLTNFYAGDYSYDVASDTITNIGLVVAGNNKTFGTKGVSDSTLTGRQWGFAPRIGVVYSPKFLRNFVVRAGFGMYYDRGEYFTELSPPSGGGISGPFGVTVEEPFVVPYYSPAGATFGAPFGTAAPPPPPANLSAVQALVPNAAQLIANTTTFCNSLGETGCGPLLFGGYDPKNSLPYSENWTLDTQWQPINTVVLDLAYVGNHGVHGVIPLPYNQALIATPQNPVLAGGPNEQIYSYGYSVPGLNAENVSTIVNGYGTGNAALRVPYLGYDPNSDFNRAVGVSTYNALQVSVNKRFSHGLQVIGSYTYSHTLDEQSGLGLFYTGNDPNNPHSSYGTSDYDRTHVFTASYHYELPTIRDASGWKNAVLNGWGFNGVTVYQSGQPYSVNDYTGGAASIYYGGGQDAVTNPIVPVGGYGATATNPVLQGTTGVNALKPVLNPAAFGIPTPYTPGTNGVPPCQGSGASQICDTYETGYTTGGRNIFRGPFQERWDMGLFKNFKISERFGLRYDLQAFNIFNHPSFDTPNSNVEFNPGYNNPPTPNYSYKPPYGYAFPPYGNLGMIQHTIGSPRFLQMALHLTF